jgi:hypothetical protein
MERSIKSIKYWRFPYKFGIRSGRTAFDIFPSVNAEFCRVKTERPIRKNTVFRKMSRKFIFKFKQYPSKNFHENWPKNWLKISQIYLFNSIWFE